MIASVRLSREMSVRVGQLLKASCCTPKPQVLWSPPTRDIEHFTSGKQDSSLQQHQGPDAVPSSILEGSQQQEVACGLSSSPELSHLSFREYPAGFRAVGKQVVLQASA